MSWPLASCTSPTTADMAPAARPGSYPNLNIPLTAAAPQITEEERQQLVSDLAARRSIADAADPAQAAAGAESLRDLARARNEERLRRIEAGE